MKIAILETGHFQYALTQSEIFSDCDKIFITTDSVKSDMLSYAPTLCQGEFHSINSINNDEKKIQDLVTKNNVDLFLISPVFDSYGALKRIVKSLKCKKVLTTHNINTWFYHRFWSPNSLMDKLNMKSIIRNCDYIAVEDFIYNHLKGTDDILFRKYKFIYIPFTIFHQSNVRKYQKSTEQLKIVLTGAIDGNRRRYEEILEVIRFFSGRSAEITFSFAGRAVGEYGKNIQSQLSQIKKDYPSLVSFFDDKSTAEMFRKEMETSDLVLSASNVTFNGMGTMEYIGKTKPTAAIHDMMSYELPGLLPLHLNVPPNLRGSVFNYSSAEDLKSILVKLLQNPSLLNEWKTAAKKNSLNFTSKIIRDGLPF